MIIILAVGLPTAYGITITLGGDPVIINGILDLMGNRITNVGTPTASTDAATKGYVDSLIAGLSCNDLDGDGLGDGTGGNTSCVNVTTDSNDADNFVCADTDGDTCDDCSSGSFDPFNDGTDTNGNGICDLAEITPSVGNLVINEIMINPLAVTDAAGEWFELYNPTAQFIDLFGVVIRDDGLDIHTIASSVIVPPNGLVVLGKSTNFAANGGVVVDYEYGNFILGNSGDQIVIEFSSTEIDRVDYISTFDTSARSKELSTSFQDAVSNDNLANWCDADDLDTLPGGDKGTPGTVNRCNI